MSDEHPNLFNELPKLPPYWWLLITVAGILAWRSPEILAVILRFVMNG